ncbi:hypothetical protein H0H92_014162 [Tricholoma furcatifolium]|nr:hypothetical protein H0H92_014162 [Tricholoma furcatifolium]
MFKSILITSLLLSYQCASAMELSRPLVARGHNVARGGTIPALLRSSQKRDSGLKRQTSCGLDSYACSDGTGCCPIGTDCGEWDGILGCCPVLETCGGSDSDPSCSISGYLECADDDFCCPAGGLCDRDSNDNPICYNADGSSAAVGTIIGSGGSASTSTTVVVAHASTAAQTTATAVFLTTSALTSPATEFSTYIATLTYPSTTLTGPRAGGDDTPTSTA